MTDLSSTAKEFRLGLKDEGSVTLDLMYIPKNAVHAALRAAYSSGAKGNFQITFTDSPATVWDFAAYVMSFPVTNGVDATTDSSVVLRVSGSITES